MLELVAGIATQEVICLLAGLVDPDGVAVGHQLVKAVLPLHSDALPLIPLGADRLHAGGAHLLADVVLNSLLPHIAVGDRGARVAVVLLHRLGHLGLHQAAVLPVPMYSALI